MVLTGARRHKLRALMFLSLVWIVFAAYAYGELLRAAATESWRSGPAFLLSGGRGLRP